MSEEALLDWLCLHVDAADLPKRFVGESVSRKAAAGIKVMSKADEQRAAQRRYSSHSFLPSNTWHHSSGKSCSSFLLPVSECNRAGAAPCPSHLLSSSAFTHLIDRYCRATGAFTLSQRQSPVERSDVLLHAEELLRRTNLPGGQHSWQRRQSWHRLRPPRGRSGRRRKEKSSRPGIGSFSMPRRTLTQTMAASRSYPEACQHSLLCGLDRWRNAQCTIRGVCWIPQLSPAVFGFRRCQAGLSGPLNSHCSHSGRCMAIWQAILNLRFKSNLTAGGACIETVVGPSARTKLFCMQGEDAIEDWEIWGDPREIERRKAERARAATPPEQRKQQARPCPLPTP